MAAKSFLHHSFQQEGMHIYFKLKTLLKKISETRCISTDKGRLLNLFNHKLKMSQNLYFDLKSHLVTYFHLSVLHPNLLHKIKRCGFFKLVLGRMNWQSAKGPSALSHSHQKKSWGSCQFMVNLSPLVKVAFMKLSYVQHSLFMYFLDIPSFNKVIYF